MSGIVGNGFMGSKPPMDWIYIHDEISGGTECYSKLLCLSAFIGEWGLIPNIAGNELQFVNNVVNFAQADLNTVGDTNLLWREQISDLKPFISTRTAYNKSNNNWTFGSCIQNTPTKTISFEEPFTICYVGNIIANPATVAVAFQRWQITPVQIISLRHTTAGLLQIILGAFANAIEVTHPFGVGQKMVIITYDGTKSAAGVEIYINDMILAKTKTVVRNALTTSSFIESKFNFHGLAGDANRINGRSDELHYFSKVLTETERIRFIEAMEQFYTFS